MKLGETLPHGPGWVADEVVRQRWNASVMRWLSPDERFLNPINGPMVITYALSELGAERYRPVGVVEGYPDDWRVIT